MKGPTAKIMAELGVPATSRAIAQHYDGLLDGLVIDTVDAGERDEIGLPVHVTPTLMKSDADREHLAREVLAFADALAPDIAASVRAVAR